MVAPGERFDRRAAAILLIDFLLVFFAQRSARVREDRQIRVFAIEVLERIAYRLDAAAHVLGDSLGDVRKAAAGVGQSAGALDDLAALIDRELAEASSATDALLVL